jgi:hypothetical protein
MKQLKFLTIYPLAYGAIIKYIKQFTHKHKILTQELKNSIALLKERRSALIAAAVMGEINMEGSR